MRKVWKMKTGKESRCSETGGEKSKVKAVLI